MKLHPGLLIASIVFAHLIQAPAQVTFAPATNYPVGQQPDSVVAVNLGGHRGLDLVGANFFGTPWDATLTLLTNNGTGSFGSNTTLTVGANPFSVMAVDVNGDGKVDLITASSSANTLTVLTNNGDGVFGSNYTITLTGSFEAFTTADVNGDGKADLIYADFVTNTLMVLTNNGSGGFVSNRTYSVGTSPDFVLAADLNGDGKVDLITANDGDNTLTILTNNGNGEFGSNATLVVGEDPLSVVAADFDGDGKKDLACVNRFSDSLSVLINRGHGRFDSRTYSVGTNPYSLVAEDVNGDGKADLICAHFTNPGMATVLINNGRGGFALATTLTVGRNSCQVIAADVNGDGRPDLITVNAGTNYLTDIGTISVLINNSVFPPATSKPSLALKHSGNGLLVSWPSASAGWSLQQNPDLTAPNWSPSGYSGCEISDDGKNKSLAVGPPTGNLFFRLLHP
ncbi:MAG TPA: VCBS repeat-containing protein [Candidatus Acidoferrum sp.]|nr:VCBS repeat-containing protein [Candidatus Acidoferrum sp.]